MNGRRFLVPVSVVTVVSAMVVGVRGYQSAATLKSAISVVPEWRQYAEAGWREGPVDAKVHLVLFSDFQCPFCRVLHDDLSVIRARDEATTLQVTRHFPLRTIHPYARGAALAAECAGQQSRFAEMSGRLFERQKEIGHRPWSAFASDAGVPDSARFRLCLGDGTATDRVDSDIRSGQRLGIRTTPLLLIDSVAVSGVVPFRVLDSLIKALAAARDQHSPRALR